MVLRPLAPGPWTIMMPLKRQIGGELLEVACHEDNQDPHGWIYVDVTGPDGKVVN